MYRPSSVVSVSSRTLSAMTMPITSSSPRTVARYAVVLAMGRHCLLRPALAEPPFGQLLVDRPAVTHGDHLDDATRAVNRVDDPKAPHPELPQALQLSPQGRPHRRVVAEGAKGVPHAALQVGVQAADDVGNVWRDDEPVSPHLPTPLARRSERLAEDLFEGEALTAGREVPPDAPDQPHERRIAQHVAGRLETLVLREAHQHRSRLALAGHHDLFLALLDAGQQLWEVCLHLGDGQGASHAARLHGRPEFWSETISTVHADQSGLSCAFQHGPQ